ncbi:MAG: 6-carboxytetrahydropterin synthase QueD [Eubacterium sp.]|nr:6-carboxytetrahydropterin synthase QueD [Eubacterium sp.]
MYILRTRSEFDSAHFLKDYNGKCANIHGHRWVVTIEVSSQDLQKEGQSRGMVVDFGKLKEDLKEETGKLDHVFIVEKDSLKPKTVEALSEEGFTICEMPFRPTAENLAKHFYDIMGAKGYTVLRARVFETPENCAEYSE